MTQIDFSMLRQSPFEGALDPVAAAIKDVMDKRHQRQMQEERLAQQREVNDRLIARDAQITERNTRAADLNERRYVGERAAKNLGSRQAIEEGIRKDVAREDYDSAEQRAKGYVEQDPATGKVTTGLPGFNIQRPPPKPAELASPVEYGPQEAPPEMPPPAPAEEGPQATPEIARQAGQIRAYEAGVDTAGPNTDHTMEAEAERQRFNAQQDGTAAPVPPDDPRAAERERFAAQNTPQKDAEMATYQLQAEKSARDPVVSLAGVPLNPEQLRRGAGPTEASDLDRLRDVLQANYATAVETQDPRAIASAQRKLEVIGELFPMVEAGKISARDAANKVFGATTAEFKRDADMEKVAAQGGQRLEQIGLQNEGKVQAAAAAGGKTAADKHGGMDPQVENVKLARIRLFNNEVENMAKRHDLPADTRNLQRAIMNVDSANSDNSVLQAAAQFGVARDITGGGGQSLSNKDVAMVAPRAGGIERLQGLAGRFIEGDQLSDAEKKVLADAIRHGMGFAKQRIAAFQDDYLGTFDNDDLPWRQQLGRQHIMGALRRYIPQSVANEKGARRPAGGARPDPSNPDDPNAPDADRPLDGDRVQVQPNAITEDDARARAAKAGLDPDKAVRNLRAKGMIR